jgi:hypothetical protein
VQVAAVGLVTEESGADPYPHSHRDRRRGPPRYKAGYISRIGSGAAENLGVASDVAVAVAVANGLTADPAHCRPSPSVVELAPSPTKPLDTRMPR